MNKEKKSKRQPKIKWNERGKERRGGKGGEERLVLEEDKVEKWRESEGRLKGGREVE